MINFLHTNIPNAVLFQYGFLTIHWYGIFMVLAILAGLFIVANLAKKNNIDSDEVYNLAFYLIIFGLLGGRIYAVFLELPFYLKNPSEIIAVWHGGLAIHGAIIGGFLTLLFYCKKKGFNFWQWADMLVVATPLAQAIGRWGNYFNQELFGKPTEAAWSIPIEFSFRPIGFLTNTHFHPTFLYESILNLLNFVILFAIYKTKKPHFGILSAIYLINYSIIRLLMEGLRIDPTGTLFGVRTPVLMSVILIIFGIGLIVFRLKKFKS